MPNTNTTSLYGTHARATGSGCASAVGRIGALLGPTLVGLILPLWYQGTDRQELGHCCCRRFEKVPSALARLPDVSR
ncbi:MAG: hypothetical protein HYZ18_10825 [Pseudogulbenkiania sp.]|nr:hypothetical protein [Pseudogulbenkiania sp.]